MSDILNADDPISELSSALYIGTLVDESENPIVGSLLTSLTMWHYDEATGLVLNGRAAQDVLQQHGVTVYDSLQANAAGRTYNLLWIMDPADNGCIGRRPLQTHVTLWLPTWVSGQRASRHETRTLVKNLNKVPAP